MDSWCARGTWLVRSPWCSLSNLTRLLMRVLSRAAARSWMNVAVNLIGSLTLLGSLQFLGSFVVAGALVTHDSLGHLGPLRWAGCVPPPLG